MYNICIYTFIILAQALQDSTAVQEKGVRKISICIHNIYIHFLFWESKLVNTGILNQDPSNLRGCRWKGVHNSPFPRRSQCSRNSNLHHMLLYQTPYASRNSADYSFSLVPSSFLGGDLFGIILECWIFFVVPCVDFFFDVTTSPRNKKTHECI